MGKFATIDGGRAKEPAPQCDWCHPSRTCHEQGFNNVNCPRVSGIQFLDGEQIHGDGWYIAAVQFGEPDVEFEVEVPPDGDE